MEIKRVTRVSTKNPQQENGVNLAEARKSEHAEERCGEWEKVEGKVLLFYQMGKTGGFRRSTGETSPHSTIQHLSSSYRDDQSERPVVMTLLNVHTTWWSTKAIDFVM